MRLRDGGMDIFYIDESHDARSYVITAVTVPFLRKVDGVWTITWPQHLEAARQWRRRIRQAHNIPTRYELHASKLASGRGNFNGGHYKFPRPKAGAVYRRILEDVDFIPEGSIITAAARRTGRSLYGYSRLEAALYALLQRMRSQCRARNVNAIVFFDEGHPEYRKLYRKAQVYLPTGTQFGAWPTGAASQNLNLDMFTKDGNEKVSKHCFFTQLTDMVAYAAFLKVKGENGELEPWQASGKLENLYDSLPRRVVNVKASGRAPKDGIVRLW